MSLRYHTWLQEAEIASHADNWPVVIQRVATILGEANASDLRKPRSLLLEGEIAARCLGLALKALEFGDFQSCWDLAKVFSNIGSSAIPELVALAKNTEAKWESRWFAIRILGEFRDPTLPMTLVLLLQTLEADTEEADTEEAEEDLNAAVRVALAQQGTAAITALEVLLNEANTRLFAVQVLAQIRTSATIPSLLTVVNDPDAKVRAIALDALSSFHDPAIPPLLIQALRDRSSAVRRIAVEGLGRRPELAETYDLIQQFTVCLGDIHPDVCQQAAISLGRLKKAVAIPALMQMLYSSQIPLDLQLTMVRAISWIPDLTALKALQMLLCDETLSLSIPVLTEVATVLGQMQTFPQEACAIAIQSLESTVSRLHAAPVRQALIFSLGQLRQDQAVEILVGCLADPDQAIQLHASAALKQFSGYVYN